MNNVILIIVGFSLICTGIIGYLKENVLVKEIETHVFTVKDGVTGQVLQEWQSEDLTTHWKIEHKKFGNVIASKVTEEKQ